MKTTFLLLLMFYTSTSFTQATSTYTLLSGTIDKYPITMHLHQNGHNYLGYYYYNSTKQPIYFIGDDTSKKNKVVLTTLTGSDVTETFTFSMTNKTATGNWKQNNKTRALSLTETRLPLQFTFEAVQGETPLRKTLKTSPTAKFQASSVWPAGSSVTDTFIKTVITEMFGDSSSPRNIISVLAHNKQSFFKDYLETNKSLRKDDIGASLNYEETDNLLISYQSAKILSLAYETYAYTGGAHGNHGTVYTSYDLVNNRQLLLSDILNTAGINKLQALLEKNFRKQNNLQATDSLTTAGLFENEIKPNDNFYVTSKGIDFAYTPYEIGPYVMGEIEIFISFKNLETYLKPEFKSLIN